MLFICLVSWLDYFSAVHFILCVKSIVFPQRMQPINTHGHPRWQWFLSGLFLIDYSSNLSHKLFTTVGIITSCSVQFSSVTQSCLTLCDPMNHSMPGLPIHHQFPEFTQTHVLRVGDVIQPSHPLSSPSPPAPNPSQHQGLFQSVNSLHEVAKVLEFQLQHQSFQWTPRNGLL